MIVSIMVRGPVFGVEELEQVGQLQLHATKVVGDSSSLDVHKSLK